jgi:branched-chain amino acid transport system permease protein
MALGSRLAGTGTVPAQPGAARTPFAGRLVMLMLVLAVLVVLPWVVPASWNVVLSKMLIASLFALAFNLLSGQAGMLSFGHAAYFAVGTFATLHLMLAAERGIAVPTPLLPAAGALAGLVVGFGCALFATLRSGVYFSMITLAIAELFYSLAPSLTGLFGGEGGLSSFRLPWAGLSFGSDREVYYLVLGWTLIGTAVLYFYTLTPFGRVTLALRENEQRVRFLGYNTYHVRVVVFATSAMIAGLAGGLLAVTNESANYILFETSFSANVVLNTFIGGSAVFLGPVLGSVLLVGFSHAVSDLTPMLPLYQGALFILVMVYAPQGLGGVIADHAAPVRSGWWPRLIGPYVLALVPGAALLAAFILIIELLQRFFAQEHFEMMRRAATLLPVQLFGFTWQPLGASTWLAPLALIVLGFALLPFAVRRIRRAWEDDA